MVERLGNPYLGPRHPYRGPGAAERAYAHLQEYHGIDPGTARERLHRIKQRSGLAPTADVFFGPTGDVWDEMSGEFIGHLTNPAA